MADSEISKAAEDDLHRFAVLTQQAEERSELIVPAPSIAHGAGVWLVAGALLRLRLSELETQINTEMTSKHRELRETELAFRQAVAALRQERANTTAQIAELNAAIAGGQSRLRLASDRLSLSIITAPVSGTLAELKVNNAGALISAGSPVATIVPASVALSVLLSVPNKDIGLIHPGTRAQIKVAAFPFQQYGTLPAEVTRVLPNVTKDNTFPVRLALGRIQLSDGNARTADFPGLTVEADLITSKQRLISVLFQSGEAVSLVRGRRFVKR